MDTENEGKVNIQSDKLTVLLMGLTLEFQALPLKPLWKAQSMCAHHCACFHFALLWLIYLEVLHLASQGLQ
jgi:hypothetical protein